MEDNYLRAINDSIIDKFWEVNNNNILLNKPKYEQNKEPEISIIVLIFNQANCIHRCLRSIQNQSLKNIEIIIVDDCSLDNSTETIEMYQKEDPRIILIKHDCNEGKIKSRSDGARKAKGKYITFIDGDDSFIHKDILQNCLNIAKLVNIDVIDFKIAVYIHRRFITILNTYNEINNIKDRIIYQPELKTKFISLIERDNVRGTPNRNICAKLIKNKLFKKVLYNIGTKFTEDYINHYEDTLMVVSLFQSANSLYLMKERGYYYFCDKCSNKLEVMKIKKCKKKEVIKGMDPIKYLNFLIDKTKDTKLETKLLYSEIISIDYYMNMTFFINHNFDMIYNVLDKTLKRRYLSEFQKEKIKKLKIKLLNKEKSIHK